MTLINRALSITALLAAFSLPTPTATAQDAPAEDGIAEDAVAEDATTEDGIAEDDTTEDATTEGATAQAASHPDLSVSTDDFRGGGSGSGSDDDSGALLLTGKIGGIVSLNGLKPFVHGALEIGYIFGGTQRTLGAYLAVEYTAPTTSGTVTEEESPERIAEGSYDWEIRQRQLVFQPTFVYRFTWLTDAVVPFAGIGPRVYLLESVVRGEAGGESFGDTKETSTKFGFGIPLGVEIPLGPGGILMELLFQWGPLEHRTTGKTHMGGISAFAGYRALL